MNFMAKIYSKGMLFNNATPHKAAGPPWGFTHCGKTRPRGLAIFGGKWFFRFSCAIKWRYSHVFAVIVAVIRQGVCTACRNTCRDFWWW